MPGEKKDNRIEEIGDEEEEDDDSGSDSMPDLDEDGAGGEGSSNRPKQNRAEKKARKAVLKLGMKPVGGVTRVTIKRAKNILFVLQKPDVYKSVASDTYVIFGDAKIEDMSSANATALSQALQQMGPGGFDPEILSKMGVETVGKPPSAPIKADATEGEPTGDLDETGLEQKDIELVMSQVQCTRGRAVQALRQHNGDIVEAIMTLSSTS
uniref:NAC-A/B domain-containing protein n=1 Tax=Chromera velia CCMP2878 TaxID=1169474 RepID=A0A0G4GNQ4_9ALVE|eukprot:Cvel_22701.t1-p1 / transcript=Cvel_22701.t1 / gene=Cvel_22701 / organism=Chromera_velia_CCMP2878 / gene_product=Nascent polypeptide-associated complex subunit, putative / transcript_product=Nascent polypeptide-associated complex subunit, putative / location=Cvel_scaffold2261:8966-11013(-) / protein_length=209 / sequence_SO=supercontig / SO=protein_coding / is_pseudo=false